MSKYAIATFIVCSVEGFVCYLIGYMVGITHDKRTITHECVKDKHDKTEPNCSEKPNICETCIWSVCNYNKVPWGKEEEPKTEPQTERSNE